MLGDQDAVIYAAGTPEALHQAVLQLYSHAKRMVSCSEPTWTDTDGEVHERTWRFIFGEANEDLTTRQRGFLHVAVFPQIAQQAVVNGERFGAKTWKEWYRRVFLGSKWIVEKLPGQKRAVPRKVRVSTEDLTSRQYSEYIDRVIAHATVELGVEFVFDQQERESVRHRSKPRKRPQAEAQPA